MNHPDHYFCVIHHERNNVQNYLNELNPSQREAVVNTDGASLVIAGAGSGKTRVLTYRIAHLLHNGTPPGSVLALTFTNKAAKEMKLRIATIVGDNVARNLWMGTFHSIFARILRIEASKLGYPSSFTIYDSADSKSVLKSIIKEMKLSDKVYKPGDVLGRISSAKNDLITPTSYLRDVNRMESDKASQKPMIYEIYSRYMRHCFKSGVMDFDDLLLNTNILFRDHPDVLSVYQNRFKYILVDEYQDTNLSQYRIIRKLAEVHQNVCVVGDDAQSIYSFRGAKIENILNFRNDYPNYGIYKLEQNYRSTQTIVEAANSIISNNKAQITKKVFSENEEGQKIKIFKAYSDLEEGILVINDLANRRLKHQFNFKDFAILYRTNAQSRIFEEVLVKRGFPFKIYGGVSFYQRKEIKDVLAYFRVAVNPNDGESLKRIINYPTRGIGDTTVGKLETFASENNISIWQVLTTVGLSALGINNGTQQKLSGFVQLMLRFMLKMAEPSAYDVAREILTDSGIIKDLHQDRSQENQSRIENVEELVNAIKEFYASKVEVGEPATLMAFLENVSLLTDMDKDDPENDDKVTMMTIHSAKGLEFKNVYIVGVEEGLFPSSRSVDDEKALEEERRLFYVALTRAEDYAAITFAKSRNKYGKSENANPSRFIGEMDQQYLDVSGDDLRQTKFKTPDFSTPNKNQNNYSNRPAVNFKFKSPESKSSVDFNYNDINQSKVAIGNRVEHERFGRGEVIDIEGFYPDVKVTVEFENAGKKQLLLKFAKLNILT